MGTFKIGDVVKIKEEYLDSFDNKTRIDELILLSSMRDTHPLKVVAKYKSGSSVLLSNDFIYPCLVLTYAESTFNINANNLTAEELEQLGKLIDKANAPKNTGKRKIWRPKEGEGYFIINGDGQIIDCRCYNNDLMEQSFVIGNCFKTKEEAKNAVERLKIRAELQRYADEHNGKRIDWRNSDQPKYYFSYGSSDNTIWTWCTYSLCEPFQVYFTSKDITKAAIKAVGEDRIKKYLFKIKE